MNIEISNTAYIRPLHFKVIEICNVAFDNEIFNEISAFLGLEKEFEALDELSKPSHKKLGYLETEFIIKSICEIESLIENGDKLSAKRSGKSLVAFIVQNFFLSASLNDKKDEQVPLWLSALVSQMKRQENFKKGYDRMCELAPCSANHLCRCFKKYYGERPSDFINRERLKYSIFLLHETDYQIVEIAELCGFSNLSHFYHLFKKAFSLSPRKARKIEQ